MSWLVERFRLGKRTGSAFRQSRYSAESWLSQKARSLASVAKSGTVFFGLAMEGSPFAVHLAGGNDAKQPPRAGHRECDVQKASMIGVAWGVVASFVPDVLMVGREQYWLVNERRVAQPSSVPAEPPTP
jgi:hypothetical protein